MASYLILIKPSFYGVVLDSMLDITPCVTEASFKDWAKSLKVFDRLTGTDEEKRAREVLHSAQALDLRSRIDMGCNGPHILHCGEQEFTYEELEQYLRDNPELVQRLVMEKL